MATAVSRFAELAAPPDWRTADFISDLHLQAGEPATFDAWRSYLQSTPADAVFILGDLFEVWVGDDVLEADASGFESRCAGMLRAASAHASLFFMHGNRDFLAGDGLMRSTGAALLADPTVLHFLGQRWLLSHGDLLCLEDVDYLRFREQVRGAEWQEAFLAQPLPERQRIARGLRDASEARKRAGTAYADVDAQAAREWLRLAGASTLLHGHTHRPSEHDLGGGLRRVVLSDWDAQAVPPRAEVLRLDAGGLRRISLVPAS